MPNYKITCVMDRYLDYNIEASCKKEALRIVNEAVSYTHLTLPTNAYV